MNTSITEGTWARVRLHPDCTGAARPHHPAEDGIRVQVSTTDNAGDHSVFALYRTGRRAKTGRRTGPRPFLPS